MLIEGNNSKAHIVTDNAELLKALHELYAFMTPGYSYTPQYKKHTWDGKTRFISRSGAFRTGLLPRLLADLKKIGCEPEINITPTGEDKELLDYHIPTFEFYDFQEKLILESLKQKRGVISSPTGSGKTIIIAGIISALQNRRVLVLFEKKQLLKQTYDFLVDECKLPNVGLCYGDGMQEGNIMLCTVQSIDRIIDEWYNTTEVLLVDECHEFSTGKVYLGAISSFPNASYRLGFTATPPSDNLSLHALEGALGPEISGKTTAELVEDKILTKPVIQLIERKYDLSGADLKLPYDEVYETYITRNEKRNALIAEITREIIKANDKPRILILTKSLEHGRALEELLGKDCQFLEGANSLGERYKAISKFRGASGPSILIGTKILQTGIDIKEITHFINARGLKSESATIQALGRTLRKSGNKTTVYVFDFMDPERYLKDHSHARKRHYIEQGHEVNIIK